MGSHNIIHSLTYIKSHIMENFYAFVALDILKTHLYQAQGPDQWSTRTGPSEILVGPVTGPLHPNN